MDHDISCINCGDSETASYTLTLRGKTHTNVPLCDECHTAILADLPTPPD
jgi:NAD-dependent SIR2 family protein deacetylase